MNVEYRPGCATCLKRLSVTICLELVHAVPIYDSLGENAVEYIVKHAGVELIFVDVSKLPEYTKVRTRSWH